MSTHEFYLFSILLPISLGGNGRCKQATVWSYFPAARLNYDRVITSP